MHGGERSFPDKIALQFQNGVTFVEIKNVIYCESDNNYTRFNMIDGHQHTVAKTLGDIQEVLQERNFFCGCTASTWLILTTLKNMCGVSVTI